VISRTRRGGYGRAKRAVIKRRQRGVVAGDQVNREVQGAGFTEGNNDDVTEFDRVFDFALRRIL